MKQKVAFAVLAAAGMFAAVPAHAADTLSPWMVRARAVYLDFDNHNADGLDKVGVGKVEADNRWIPEVDISYFFTQNIAAELVLTYPQHVDIKTGALGKIGHVSVLPPSLLVQYHFTDFGAFKPYVGAGLNYTVFTKKRFSTGLGEISVDHDSFGLVAQVGADYALTRNWSLNLDVKYVQMDTDVKLEGSKLGKLDLNPVLVGVGFGYRF